MSREWVAWHQDYPTDPGRAGRLRVVQELLARAIDRAPHGRVRLVSLCAGDGRDLLGVLPSHPRRAEVSARLVEFEPELLGVGREAARRSGLGSVEFFQGDAASRESYFGAVPANIVLACGIFGNISDEDVRRTVTHLPELCAPGAVVIWTRGRFEPDLTPSIRSWFKESGFVELAFVPIPGSTAAVGAHQLVRQPHALEWDGPLFTFLPKSLRPSARGRHDCVDPEPTGPE